MKKVNWVVDKYLFDEYEDKLSTAIKNSGSNVYYYDDLCGKTFKEWITDKFTEDDIVVFHGSLQHGRQLLHLPIYPGVFMTIDNYECYKYYGYYGNNLFNSTYMMMGLNDVVRNKWDILQLFPRPYNDDTIGTELEDKLFIRPSNGYKTFTGQLLDFNNLEKDVDILMKSYGGVDPETLVLISKAKIITHEWRFIVIDGKVVSGSMYMDSKNKNIYKAYYNKPINSGKAYDFAVKMAKLHTPDKAYTIDVCRTKYADYNLLEINSFNCASMYGADYDSVVAAFNELAIKEYNELFNI